MKMPRLSLLRSKSGSIGTVFVLTLPVIIAFAAVAVDLGAMFLSSRRLQGVADLAAMSAAANISQAQTAANATVGANGFDGAVTVRVTLGQYSNDPTIPTASRFTATNTSPNAAQVTLITQTPVYFGQMLIGAPSVTISRKATAAQAQMASFQIGSGLASLQGGVANTLLSGLTGSTVNLSVMNYNALASANVDLFQYMSALSTRESLQGVSYSSLLSNQTSTATALNALADVLNQSGSTQAAASVTLLAQAAGTGSQVNLSTLFNLGPYGSQDHVSPGSGANVSVDALDMAQEELMLAQGGRQVQLNFAGSVPGVTNLTAYLAIGQRATTSPWIGIDNAGTVIVHTAQMRLYLEAQVPGTGVLTSLGGSIVNVPIYVELAQAEAKLASLTCASSSANDAVSLSVAPSVGQIALGQVNLSTLNNFSQEETISPAVLLNAVLIQATGTADTNLGGQVWQNVAFSESDIANGVVKTVDTTNIAQASVASTLSNTSLSVQLLGTGILIGQVPASSALSTTLNSVAPSLDQVLNGLEGLTGLGLGEASVKIDGLRCNGAALVA